MTEQRAEKAEVTLKKLELTVTIAQKTAKHVLERNVIDSTLSFSVLSAVEIVGAWLLRYTMEIVSAR